MSLAKIVGKRIAAARKQAGLSQTELADKIGVTRAAVSGWERGQEPLLSHLRDIARITKVSLAWLLGETSSMRRCPARRAVAAVLLALVAPELLDAGAGGRAPAAAQREPVTLVEGRDAHVRLKAERDATPIAGGSGPAPVLVALRLDPAAHAAAPDEPGAPPSPGDVAIDVLRVGVRLGDAGGPELVVQLHVPLVEEPIRLLEPRDPALELGATAARRRHHHDRDQCSSHVLTLPLGGTRGGARRLDVRA
jgi:transcriptional regulator with XRE-family HTH domain